MRTRNIVYNPHFFFSTPITFAKVPLRFDNFCQSFTRLLVYFLIQCSSCRELKKTPQKLSSQHLNAPKQSKCVRELKKSAQKLSSRRQNSTKPRKTCHERQKTAIFWSSRQQNSSKPRKNRHERQKQSDFCRSCHGKMLTHRNLQDRHD